MRKLFFPRCEKYFRTLLGKGFLCVKTHSFQNPECQQRTHTMRIAYVFPDPEVDLKNFGRLWKKAATEIGGGCLN